MSLDTSGSAEGNLDSTSSSVSDDGRFVAFASNATNLVAGDTNGAADVFLRDRQTGVTTLVSVALGGGPGTGTSTSPSISDDGRFVAFASSAADLVAGDVGGLTDIFVRDTQTGLTLLVSRGPGGVQANASCGYPRISGDGAFVTYNTAATNLAAVLVTPTSDNVYRTPVGGGGTILVSIATPGVPGNGASWFPFISTTGQFVAFSSSANNLVAGDTNGREDAFVRDILAGTTTCVSIGPGGVGNDLSRCYSISGDGRFVGLNSWASDLVAFDNNNVPDVFLRDRLNATTVLCSVDASGVQGNFDSIGGAVSDNGQFVAFLSGASNLAPPDTNNLNDIVVKDMVSGAVRCVSRLGNGVQSNDQSQEPSISGDGRFVTFWSSATNLVPTATNAFPDVYLSDALNTNYCQAKVNSQGCTPFISMVGTPSATAASGFVISGTNALSNKVGLILYGLNGPDAVPFDGGTLCVGAPVRRSVSVNSGGNWPPTDCSGVFALDFNTFARGTLGGSPQPGLSIPGTVVHAQWWGRDAGFPAPNNVQLTDAVVFVIGP